MKKTNISILYDDEKLSAKYVPSNVREFIDMKTKK